MKLSDCKLCPMLVSTRNRIVSATGTFKTDIMFIGDAPGKEDDKEGVPFVGRAGKVFNRILEYLGLSRETVFITYVIKCKPMEPNSKKNRQPTPQEMLNCSKWLELEIKKVKPKLIVVMGSVALEKITGLRYIMRHHGRAIKSERHKCYIFPSLSPAATLYDPTGTNEMLKVDLKKLKRLIKWLRS